MAKPVLFLAFANDRVEPGGFLRSLNQELKQIRAALLDDAGRRDRGEARWTLHDVADATVDDLVDGLQRHRDRVALFHYGGHAGDYALLLQSASGARAVADAGGLARLLGAQRGLQLVFLNGCSTRGHVDELLAAGVPAVIATRHPVEDAIALDVSRHFYAGLATGASIGRAFAEAMDAARTAIGGGVAPAPNAPATSPTRGFDVADAPGTVPNDSLDDRLPWELHIRPGAESVREWSLGAAAGDPLFGLPSLPPVDLPAEPFLHLRWFGPEHAPLFFGRGAEIRALYDRVTESGAPPIILLYGQSGAGKSSLLAAGLLPRLRATHRAAYLRRDEALGLPAALRKALALGADAPVDAAAWRAMETRLGAPLVVVLDQVEEAFTKPRATPQPPSLAPSTVPPSTMPSTAVPPGSMPPSAMPPAPVPPADAELAALYGLAPAATPLGTPPRDEIGALVADLAALFRDQAARPAGRLVLGFRKEWLAEIRARLVDARLPFAEVFLDRLGRGGIVEAVTGPAREPALRACYRLTVDDHLAEVVADDLLVDPDAPIAPTLQVLLAKLWHAAPPARDGARRFDRALYQPLRDAGILLGDFLDQQLDALGTSHADAVASGLALDVLAFHTTAYRTARTCTRDELLAAYPYAADALPALLQRCTELLLLVEPSDDDAGAATAATRLAHDTLAPLVRDRHDASDRAAQRARRILESRAPEWRDGRAGRLLDDVDLATVEAGGPGMRAWTPDERRLVEASRAAARARWAERTLAQAAAAGDPLEAARLLAQLADEPEPPNGLAIASAIARQAIPVAVIDPARLTDGAGAPAVGAVLGLAAGPEGTSFVALGESWAGRIAPRPETGTGLRPLMAYERPVRIVGPVAAEIDPTGRRAAMASAHVTVLWSVDDPAEPFYLTVVEAEAPVEETAAQAIMNLWFDAGGDALVTTTNSEVFVWDLVGEALVARVPGGGLCRPALSANARWLAVGGHRIAAKLYELSPDGEPVERLALGTEAQSAGTFAFDAAETRLLAKAANEPLRLWSLDDPAAEPRVFEGSSDAVVAAFNPGYHQVVAGCVDGSLRVWFYRGSSRPDVVRAHDRIVHDVQFSPDGTVALSVSDDGTAKLWEQPLFTELATLRGHRGRLRSAAFSADGTLVATVGDGDAMRVWSTQGLTEPMLLRRHQPVEGTTSYEGESFWRIVRVARDGRHFAIAAADGTVRVTPLVGEPATVTLRYRDLDADAPSCVALGVDDGQVTIVLGDGAVLRAAVDADATLTTPARAGKGAIAAAAVSPDGRAVAIAFAGDAEHLVHRWSLDGDADRVLRGCAGEVQYLAFSADGRRVAAIDSSATLVVWPTDGASMPAPSAVYQGVWSTPVFSADGARIAARTHDGGLGVWNADGSGAPILLPNDGPRASGFAFGSDGATLVVGSEDTTVGVWRVGERAPATVLAGHRGPVTRVALSADGGRILTTSDDGSARVWRTDGTGSALVLVAAREEVESAAFTPDGRRVVTRDRDGLVRLWSVSWTDLVRHVQRAVRAVDGPGTS